MLHRILYLLTITFFVLIVAGCGNPTMNQAPTLPDQSADSVSDQAVRELEPVGESTPDRESTIVWTLGSEGEPNNDLGTAPALLPFYYIEGSVDEASDQNDYFWIDHAIAGSIYVKLGWYDPTAMLNVFIYDSVGAPVIYDGDNHPSPKDLWLWDEPGGTSFYIRVKAAWGSSDYRLKYAYAPNSEEPENNTIEGLASADPMSLGKAYRRCASSDVDINDYYKLDVNPDISGGLINFVLDWVGPDNPDFNLFLYEPDYTPVVYSSGSARPEAFTVVNPAEGTYYVRVKANAGEGIYELNVEPKSIIIFDPHLFFEYEYDPIPWPDPGPLIEILDHFDPWMFDWGGTGYPGQGGFFTPQPGYQGSNPFGYGPGETMPQMPTFGF